MSFENFEKEGLIFKSNDIIYLTPRGLYYVDYLQNIPIPNFFIKGEK